MPHIAQERKALPHNPAMAGLSPDSIEKFRRTFREKNSGDQIFGRDLRKGTVTSKAGNEVQVPSAKPPIDGDHALPSEMPLALGASLFDTLDGVVQWKAGGFSVIKKPRSSSAVQEQRIDHPVMESALKQYPTVSQLHRRDGTSFLPMATRKINSFTAVETHEDSGENQELYRSRWTLNTLLDKLGRATSSVLEPLNEEKMRQQALQHLKDKTEERMRLEGVASEKEAL
eukprot:5071159-Amphidinium_carterae.1